MTPTIKTTRVRLLATGLAIAALLLLPKAIDAQVVMASQRGTVSQWIADAHFEIEYDRPVARGRELFGALVPWNEVWTPSANLALRFSVSRDVIIEGRPVPAGDYSLWLEPRNDRPWRFLLNETPVVGHNAIPEDGWVLDIEVEPRRATHIETVTAYFSNANRREGAFDIQWGETALTVRLEVPEMEAP